MKDTTIKYTPGVLPGVCKAFLIAYIVAIPFLINEFYLESALEILLAGKILLAVFVTFSVLYLFYFQFTRDFSIEILNDRIVKRFNCIPKRKDITKSLKHIVDVTFVGVLENRLKLEFDDGTSITIFENMETRDPILLDKYALSAPNHYYKKIRTLKNLKDRLLILKGKQ